MLVDRYLPEDVFARVPEVAQQTDPVLKRLDQLLEDDQLYKQVRADLGKRYRYTLVHGRHSTPVEVILRMLLCKHLYGWSYEETRERVADSLVLRWFCRVYFQTVPDKSTLIRWTHTLRPETLHALNDRVTELAKQAKVTTGRKLRLDATCVQTTIHHPTDSGLLVDSVRVLSRLVKRAKPLVAEQLQNVGAVCRSRRRSGSIDSCDARARRRSSSKRRTTGSSSRRPSRWCGKPSEWFTCWNSRLRPPPNSCMSRRNESCRSSNGSSPRHARACWKARKWPQQTKS
jgi:hypothetical protein